MLAKCFVHPIPQKARNLLEAWIEKFGNRVYLALNRTERVGEEDFINKPLNSAANIKLVSLHIMMFTFVEQDDFEAHEATCVCIADGYVW